MENFRLLLKRAGLELSGEEMESLKPIYDFYADSTAVLRELDLGAEDLAVAFSPEWETGPEVTR